MAARNLAPLRALDRDVTLIFSGCTGNATSQPTSVRGPGVTSIVRSGVGVLTVTLTDKWNNILFVTGSVIDAGTVDDWEITITAISASSKTVALQVFKGGAAADLPTTAQLRLMIAVGNTTQPAGGTRP